MVVEARPPYASFHDDPEHACRVKVTLFWCAQGPGFMSVQFRTFMSVTLKQLLGGATRMPTLMEDSIAPVGHSQRYQQKARDGDMLPVSSTPWSRASRFHPDRRASSPLTRRSAF